MLHTKLTILLCLLGATIGYAQNGDPDSLIYPLEPTYDPTQSGNQSFDLGDPTGMEQTIVYDPITGTYIFTETIGNDLNYRNPSVMTFDEYVEYERQKALKENWRGRIDEQTQESQPFQLPIKIDSKVFESFFGSDEIVITPQGNVELSFGVNSSRYDNPILPVRQRRITRFDFQQQIKLNLTGQIGTKLKINTSYDTQAAFNFDNISTLEYAGNEDQIMQKIALGNVSFTPPTSLIPGSQTLFGASTQLRFGKTYVDLIAASSRGQRKEITIEGEAQQQQFELTADNYEANRHYFINHYHRDHYDEAMKTVPIANTTINITRIEVWVTNRNASTENTRNILAFADLGEALPENCEGNPGNFWVEELPDNDANGLYAWASTQPLVRGFVNSVSALSSQVVQPGPFQQAVHYEKVENARMLSEQEFTYNAQMGFVSLNLPLNNDEVLGVAYEYTYRNETYKVGEFSTDGSAGQDALILKMLRPTLMNPKTNTWDLMMKNVYSIGAYQLDQQGFRMDVLYNNPETSVLIPYFPYEGVDDEQLVTLVDMDRINFNYQPFSDGVLDFVPLEFDPQVRNKVINAGTINARNGRVYFSTIEPFGTTLKGKLLAEGLPPAIVDGVVFQELYDSTQIVAQLIPAKNRFSFKGQYQSSISSDIPLNVLNVPEGGVTVTAGGLTLIEGVDYTVDYNLGRVKILNSGVLESGTPINISVESNNVFGFQARSLIGSRVSHRFNERFNIGATWMRMMERPVTQKVDIGSEPYKNNVIGADIQFSADVPFLTKMVDFLPGISTKAKSTIDFQGEFAHLIPGQPRVINRDGTSYIDDFEGAQSTIDLRSFTAWNLASVPQGQPDLFPEASTKNLSAGFKRSKLAWYVIDPYFYQTSEWTSNQNQISDSRMRLVQFQEIWPNQVNQYGTPTNVPVLDLAYYPEERGMYNYDTTATFNADGTFVDPANRWGGVMRALTTNNFEQTNIEYIQFWLLDPFNDDAEAENPGPHTGGDLYFNLGNISEDILPDSRKSFEHGLPTTTASLSNNNLDTTTWAQVSTQQVVVNAFDANPDSRVNQDVGIDGWSDEQERIHYENFLNWIPVSGLSPEAQAALLADPSSDNYNYYRDDVFDAKDLNILERYKKFNGMEGNSFTTEMSDTANAEGYPTLGSNSPDIEDINQDNNLSETESYFQYKISMRPQDMVVGQNYITSVQEYTIGTPNGNKVEKWYQFRVPIVDYQKRVNGISDFRSIRFMRMFLKEFDEEVVLRFARLEFIRGEWRRYAEDLTEPGDGVTVDPNLTTFNIGAVNIQENEQRSPVQYVIPPGIQQEIDPSQPIQRPLNEQSLLLEVCNLQDGDARAAFRNVQFDIRTYKRLKMFVHGEAIPGAATPLNDEDVTVFIRLGTDFTDNYYEYELPVNLTQPGASSDLDIWPESNNIDIEFQKLLDLKQDRNADATAGVPGVANNVIYERKLDNEERIIRVKGNPNLQGLRTIMIGVRNPGENSHDLDNWREDGQEKCAIIWVNELRLTDFVDEGGSAATASMRVQFADFANLNVSGNYSGINWGNVDSRVQERQRNEQIGFDLNANVQLGQFFGRKARVSLPFFYGYSLGIVNPEYDPLNPDIKLSEYTDLAERRRRAKLGQDFAERRSYNFSGVRKELKAGATNRFWRISNWTASYAYTENLLRDFTTESDITKTWTGNLAYNYSFNAKPIMPFKKSKFLKKSKWFKIIREMNFYPMPKNVSFTNDIMRSYNERQIRSTVDTSFTFRPVYVKQFNWNRSYNLGWDLTKKLKFQFSATNRSLFQEADGRVDRRSGEGFQEFSDTVGQQLMTFGTPMDYTHNYSFSYNLPLDQIPATDWINANIKYQGTYNWQRGPLAQPEFGNTIQNSRTINMTAQANFTNLYNKVPWLKRVISDGRSARGGARGQAANPRRNTTDGPNANESPETKLEKPEPPKPVEEMTEKEKRKWERTLKKWERKVKREEKRKKRNGKVHPIAGFTARALMSVRNVSGTYNVTNGTVLPGYRESVGVLGMDPSFNSGLGGFIFGQQRYDVWGRSNGYNVATTLAGTSPTENPGFLVFNQDLNRQYTNTRNQTLNLRSTVQPIKDLSIEFTLNRTYSTSENEFFRWNDDNQSYSAESPFETRTLTYSNVSFSSAFTTLGGNFESTVFDRLLESRKEVSQLLGTQNPNSSELTSGFYDGYGKTQQDVIIGAFMTSFSNRSVNDRNVNPVENMPLPNWSLNYNGLKNFEFMKNKLKNFVIRHSYSNTVSVSGMQTNMDATFDNGGFADSRDLNNNFIPGMVVQNIAVSERFSPLIGLDATWLIKTKGKPQGLITKFEYKKDRNATLSLNNNQVTEILGNEWVIGTGYKFTKVKLPFGKLEASDLNIRIDVSFRDNLTVIRKISEETNQATAGQQVISIRSSADYNLNKYLVVSFYYDQTLNTPKVTTSFPTGNLSTGLRLRFNLAGVN
ncbi:MAG: cell surface protein SprA [Crocinitomicaceae bacterium]